MTDRSHYYDRQGNPATMMEWAQEFEAHNRSGSRRVAFTKVGNVHVSTVWMGLDHSFGAGPPLIFESMIFGGPLDQEQDRYSTEEQALAGHDQMVARAREASSDRDEQEA